MCFCEYCTIITVLFQNDVCHCNKMPSFWENAEVYLHCLSPCTSQKFWKKSAQTLLEISTRKYMGPVSWLLILLI